MHFNPLLQKIADNTKTNKGWKRFDRVATFILGVTSLILSIIVFFQHDEIDALNRMVIQENRVVTRLNRNQETLMMQLDELRKSNITQLGNLEIAKLALTQITAQNYTEKNKELFSLYFSVAYLHSPPNLGYTSLLYVPTLDQKIEILHGIDSVLEKERNNFFLVENDSLLSQWKNAINLTEAAIGHLNSIKWMRVSNHSTDQENATARFMDAQAYLQDYNQSMLWFTLFAERIVNDELIELKLNYKKLNKALPK